MSGFYLPEVVPSLPQKSFGRTGDERLT